MFGSLPEAAPEAQVKQPLQRQRTGEARRVAQRREAAPPAAAGRRRATKPFPRRSCRVQPGPYMPTAVGGHVPVPARGESESLTRSRQATRLEGTSVTCDLVLVGGQGS